MRDSLLWVSSSADAFTVERCDLKYSAVIRRKNLLTSCLPGHPSPTSLVFDAETRSSEAVSRRSRAEKKATEFQEPGSITLVFGGLSVPVRGPRVACRPAEPADAPRRGDHTDGTPLRSSHHKRSTERGVQPLVLLIFCSSFGCETTSLATSVSKPGASSSAADHCFAPLPRAGSRSRPTTLDAAEQSPLTPPQGR